MNKDYKKIAETTLKILDKKPWDNITLKEIQTKSKVKKFNLLIKNKKDLLIKLNNYFDYKVSSKISNIENSNYKDMIFEVIMMRFDVLQENRKGIKSIFDSFKSRPKLVFFLIPISFPKSIVKTIAGLCKLLFISAVRIVPTQISTFTKSSKEILFIYL